MKKKYIYLASPHMSQEGYEKQFINEAFDTNWIAPMGKNVDEFEKEMAQRLGVKATVALNSGTAAIHLALKAVGVKEGDIVLCPTLTFSATVNPVLYEKAVPVFIDSDYETWNMNPDALEYALKKYIDLGKKPKAILVVHLYGLAANMERIVSICNCYQVPIIEDAAESLGTTINSQFTNNKPKYTGTFGDYGIISFNGNKIITSSGGGMLLCNTEDAVEKADKVRFWATQARDKARHYQHSEIGYNYRMSNIVAGIGRGQLKVLDERVDKKRYIYDYYKRMLGELKGITFMPLKQYERCNCWLTVIRLSSECKITAYDIMLALEKDYVETRPVWKPMHLQPFAWEYDFISINDKQQFIDKNDLQIIDIETGADNSISGTLFEQGICIPSDTKLTDDDLDRICKLIKSVWVQNNE